MPQITGESEWLLQEMSSTKKREIPNDVAKIKLNQLVSKLGFFYEKVRNAIDYNEEHLIRRTSLKRLLNRQVNFLMKKNPIKISETLIHEFIRAKYLPNDELPETDIEEVAIIIAKYLMVLQYFTQNPPPDYKKVVDWVTGLMVCEIDEFLFSDHRETALINYAYGEMVKSINFSKSDLDEKERNLQIYIAVLRNLIKADQQLLNYLLFKLYQPNWNNITPEETKKLLPQLLSFKKKIEQHLNHPSGYQIGKILKTQAIFFNIIKEIISDNLIENREIFNNENKLTEKIREVCHKKYKTTRTKLLGSIFRVIIYIFLTKTILAILLELPYDQIFLGHINWLALIINVIFHPILMAIIALTIKIPGPQNTEIIIEEIKKIIYGSERKLVYKPKNSLRFGSWSFIIFNSIYSIMFLASFGVILWILYRLNFNFLSGALFIFFLTLVSFFGFRLRNIANQYSVIPRKENFRNFLIDFFTLPIISVGRFLSVNFSKINIMIYILDFIIETPFKALIETLDKALGFIREKREEIS